MFEFFLGGGAVSSHVMKHLPEGDERKAVVLISDDIPSTYPSPLCIAVPSVNILQLLAAVVSCRPRIPPIAAACFHMSADISTNIPDT